MNRKLTALLYTSATGFTRRYAQLLSDRTGLPLCDLSGGPLPDRGAPVLYLGWLCAGGIKGLKKACARYDVRAVCAVGMAPAEEAYTAKLRRENGADSLPFFYLRGGYAPEKLTGAYRLMMVSISKMASKAPAEDESARAMKDAFQGGDWVSPEQLAPVLAWLDY